MAREKGTSKCTPSKSRGSNVAGRSVPLRLSLKPDARVTKSGAETRTRFTLALRLFSSVVLEKVKASSSSRRLVKTGLYPPLRQSVKHYIIDYMRIVMR